MNENDKEIESLLDNLDFKPITDGLGFHHSLKEKKQVKTDLNQQSESLKNEFELRAKELVREIPQEKKVATNIHRGDLTPFYEQEQEVQAPLETLKLDEVEEEEITLFATMPIRFGAWLIDVILLVVSMVITFASIIYFADLPLETLSVFMVTDEIFSSLAFIGLSFYVFYFSVLDKTGYGTVGKNILGINIVDAAGKQMSLYISLFRTLLSLSSVLLLGLPVILDMHSKLTDTKVIQK